MRLQGRWAWVLVIVLVVSLSLNFFVAGFVVRRGMLRPFGPPPPFMELVRGLPPSARRQILDALAERRHDFRTTQEQVEAIHRDILVAARAPTLDVARIRKDLEQIRGIIGETVERAQDAFIAALADVPAEERAKIEVPPPRP